MSIHSKAVAGSYAIRRRLPTLPWRSPRPYSPVFSIALLLIVGFAVKISH
jgi:hypothetical protein